MSMMDRHGRLRCRARATSLRRMGTARERMAVWARRARASRPPWRALRSFKCVAWRHSRTNPSMRGKRTRASGPPGSHTAIGSADGPGSAFSTAVPNEPERRQRVGKSGAADGCSRAREPGCRTRASQRRRCSENRALRWSPLRAHAPGCRTNPSLRATRPVDARPDRAGAGCGRTNPRVSRFQWLKFMRSRTNPSRGLHGREPVRDAASLR